MDFPTAVIQDVTSKLLIFSRLQVLPGFITSILQYENSVLLNCDISHKILRSDTVLDILYDMYQRSGERFYDDAVKKFVGSIVLTRLVSFE